MEPASASGLTWAMAPLVLGGLLIVFSLWWLYFSRDHVTIVEDPRSVWLFGYGHLPIFASTAAVGSALAAGVDVVRGQADAGPRLVALALAVAISVVALTLAGLHALGSHETVRTMLPAVVVSALCLATALLVPSTGFAVLLMGLVLTALVAQRVLSAQVPSAGPSVGSAGGAG